MSKPRYRWWLFVRNMIRDYPSLRKELADIQRQSIVASVSGMPRGGSSSRASEMAALRQLEDPDDQQCYEAVASALEITRLRPDGKERLRLIELVYWVQKPMTISDAAYRLHVSDRTAAEWHRNFVRCVAACYGFNVK